MPQLPPLYYLLALLAGGVIHLGLAPYDLWLAGFAGLLLFATLISLAQTPRLAFYLALAFGIGLFGAGVNWVYVSIHTYGEVPALLAAVFTGLFVLCLALLFALPWLLYPLLGNSRSLRLTCFPLFWLLSEWLRGWLLTGFPWLYLGYGQVDGPLSGWLPLVGVLGTGGLYAAAATALIFALTKRSTTAFAVAAIVLLAVFLPGKLLSDRDWTQAEGGMVPVTLVQPDIPLRDKWNPLRANEISKILEQQSAGAWNSGLLVWPEAAIPFFGRAAEPYVDFLDSLAQQSDTAMITGLLTYDAEQDRFLNSIAGLGSARGLYHKRRLVPFGEYVPLEAWLRGTMQFFDLPMSVISRGPEDQPPLVFDYLDQSYRLAPALCYEIAYADLVRTIAREADILITLSNDSWFGTSIGPWQHMQIARARALENQKPLIRVTNNGITALVDHRGQISTHLPQFTRARLQGTVAPRSGTTPYTAWGNLPIGMLALLAGLVILVFSVRNRHFQARLI